ncbi:MAG: pyridoxamine 5'-phosphate oxidase family protein [Eubacteriaceae bacterium]|nr:pyridoxamine 5'-phosphate oxidase family protein [Eubacteriaceae bacterium]
MIEKVKEVLRKNHLCVLCTESSGNPYCSLMTYLLSEDGSILYMTASMKSRKYLNLQSNPKVSLLVDTRMKPGDSIISITLEGVVLSEAQEDMEMIRTSFIQRHPELLEILNDPYSVLLGIKLKTYLLLDGPVRSFKGVF